MRQFIQQKLRNLGSNNLKDENEHTSHPAPQRKAAAQTLSHAEPGRNTGEQVNRETSTAENNAKRCASGGQAIHHTIGTGMVTPTLSRWWMCLPRTGFNAVQCSTYEASVVQLSWHDLVDLDNKLLLLLLSVTPLLTTDRIVGGGHARAPCFAGLPHEMPMQMNNNSRQGGERELVP